MTGTEEKGEAQAQSSVPSKRKSTAPEAVEEKGHTRDRASPKKRNNSGGVRFTLRNPQWAYLHLELYGTTPSPYPYKINSTNEKHRVTQPTPSSSTTPTPPPPPALDHLTARSYLTSALSQFLGITGTSIPIDILKLDTDSKTSNTPSLWIRVPQGDLVAVTAALSSWIGGGGGAGSDSVAFRVCARGSWLGALVGGNGEDLFS